MKTEVHYCGACQGATNQRVEETKEYTIRTCEQCGGVTTLKQLNWNVDNMLTVTEWERPK